MGGQTRYPSRIDEAIDRGVIRPVPFSLPDRLVGELRKVRPVRVWALLAFPTVHGIAWIERQATAVAWNSRFVAVEVKLPDGDLVMATVFASACRRFDADAELEKRRSEMDANRRWPRRP